jgi:hypothetical protein
MISQTTTLYPKWKELLKVAEHWEYGSFHTHEEIAEILGIELKTTKYYHAIKSVDEQLIIIGRKFENIIGKGYRLINPDEFVRSSNTKVKKAMRFTRCGIMISGHAPRDKMDPFVKKRTDEHTIHISRTYSILASESKPLFEIEQKIASRQLRSENPRQLTNGD